MCPHGPNAPRRKDNRDCQLCANARSREYYKNNKTLVSEKAKALYSTEKARKKKGLPEPTRVSSIVCECCGRSPKKGALHLDHCHETGKFRGWLCGQCNRGIGLLGDNLEGIKKAMTYMDLYGK